MKLNNINIQHYRSIENISIDFPHNKPAVLFGPNNVGKSNILKALTCFLGEKYTPYIDFLDSDYYFRNKEKYPNISFEAEFDDYIYPGNYRAQPSKNMAFTTNLNLGQMSESCFHYKGNQKKMYIGSKDRERCQFILIDATRNLSSQLSYYSRYTILSKFTQKMHKALVKENKVSLDKIYSELIASYEKITEYQEFKQKLKESFEESMKGFTHKLAIDFSAYDPNNYFKSLRVMAKEGKNVRSFDEFGTGEQQILLISFIRAYAEIFKGESFILGIEEPESHLHPLAQKWFAQNLELLSSGSVQVILSTHSPEFLKIANLEGFVKVYKKDGITKTQQIDATKLANHCITHGSNPKTTDADNILNFYQSNTFHDQTRGFFAEKVILVEGETEFFTLPIYFSACGFDLLRDGVEIINCRGKGNISRNYRLFSAYGYDSYCIFDADEKKVSNKELATIFGFNTESMKNTASSFVDGDKYGYFGIDYENYLRVTCKDYSEQEAKIQASKPLKAKIISENNKFCPPFITMIAKQMGLTNYNTVSDFVDE